MKGSRMSAGDSEPGEGSCPAQALTRLAWPRGQRVREEPPLGVPTPMASPPRAQRGRTHPL